MNTAPVTRASLIAGLQRSDPAVWRCFCALYLPFLYGLARRLCGQETDALDLCQEVLLRVFRRINTFHIDPDRAGFRAWLFMVVRNLHRDRVRKRTPLGSGDADIHELLDQLPDPSGISEAQYDVYTRLHLEALARVASRHSKGTAWYADAYYRIDILLEDEAAVAEALGMSVHVVRTARTRVRKAVEKELT